MRRTAWMLAGAIALGSISGCHVVGPPAAREGRVAYNAAVQQSSSEQLLLNLVRLRYREPATFLEVASVSTSFELTSSASAGGSLFPNASSDEIAIGGSVLYSEQPTITYLPLQGHTYVEQMLTPIDLTTIALLFNTGWRIDRVLGVMAQRLGQTVNAPRASGPTPDRAPDTSGFFEALEILGSLYNESAIDVQAGTVDDEEYLVIDVADELAPDERVARLAEVLGLDGPRQRFVFSSNPFNDEDDVIRITTRSVVGSMYYLSHATEVDEADMEAGVVTTTRDEDDAVFDWSEVSGRFLQIRSAERRPARAAVTVRHRGRWFYLDDADLNSKSTFVMLGQAISLKAGDIESAGPLLTLPVGR